MAKSRDLVIWEDCEPALRNGAGDSYDRLGVFSGSIISKLIDEKRLLFLFYTSVSALPIHWSKPYIKGCESQSVAVSRDFGHSWQKFKNNPVLNTPPKGVATTGWRDPFVSQWPSLSQLLGVSRETVYMLISSGERGYGSQLHIYISDGAPDNWNYLSTILNVESGSRISANNDVCFGFNFECASFFSISNNDYLLVGVEEGHDSPRHNGHLLLWLAGTLVLREGKPYFEISGHGLLDHGVLYASHIFRDSEDRLLQLGWADETAEDHIVKEQGWAGCLAYPRELFEISEPLHPEVAKRNPQWTVDEVSGHMSTLGIRPAPQLSDLRKAGSSLKLRDFQGLRATTFEVKATFPSLSGTERFTFNVRESPDGLEVTKIIIDVESGCICVDRSQSSLLNLGTTTPDIGSFRLLPGEDVHVTLYVDVSIIEIYANDRFAMTSRIYPSLPTSVYASCDLGGFEGHKACFEIWYESKNAWPARDTGHPMTAR